MMWCVCSTRSEKALQVLRCEDDPSGTGVHGKRRIGIGKPEEIARAILFLADSEQSSFMTGQSMIVDGGATVRLSTE
jgi:NAD(P)-dependent dehydrogenase (short-subunit alcohol dehydrogenase family)